MQNVPSPFEHEHFAGDIAVVGAADVVISDGDRECDPMAHLRVKKLRKYMGRQDDMAVVAACTAVQTSERACEAARDRIGLYLGVGYIPFEQQELARLATAADAEGQFSMLQLSTTGYHAVNGLLTFRCLPNMPAFHISTNLNIQGPCFVTYPGAGQFYMALQQACHALEDRGVDVALVAGVAHQRNFLVQHHFHRLQHRQQADLVDAAGCLVLERMDDLSKTQRPMAELKGLEIQYETFDPFQQEFAPQESFRCGDGVPHVCSQAMGPAGLPVLLSQAISQRGESPTALFGHQVATRDGIGASSQWELL